MQRLTIAALGLGWFVAAGLPTASAQEGFRSPTGNIHCQYFAGDGDPVIRCDLRQVTNRSLPRPRNCDLEWGQAFEISARASRGTPLCYGDTVQDDRLPFLPYGQNWQRGGLTCISEPSGVSCRNPRGHGFTLSRGKQSVF